MAAIEKAIRDSDLGVNPTNDGTDHPGGLPAAHRGAPQGVRQGRAAQGRGRQGLDPQHPPARQGRARQAGQGRRGRRGRRRAAPRRSSRRSPTSYVGADRRAAQAQGSRAARGLRAGHPRETRDTMSTDQEAEGGSPLEPVPMQAVPPPERRSRAGRNLPAAIGVGLGLGALILVALYVWKPAFVVVIAGGGRARRLGADPRASRPTGSGCPSSRWPSAPRRSWSSRVRRRHRGAAGRARADRARGHARGGCPENPTGYLRDVTAGDLRRRSTCRSSPASRRSCSRDDDGADRVVVFIALVVLSDIGGYVAGVLFGKHPMAPHRQPEEVVGGLRRLRPCSAPSAAPSLLPDRARRRVVAGRPVRPGRGGAPRRSATSASR